MSKSNSIHEPTRKTNPSSRISSGYVHKHAFCILKLRNACKLHRSKYVLRIWMLFYILDVHFQGGPQADDEQSNVFCNFIHLRTKTIHHRAVMTWMAKWLAEVYLPSIGPDSQDMAVRYILRFLVSLMESLTNLCTGFCQLWNWLLPLQTPILTGISHFLYHLTY